MCTVCGCGDPHGHPHPHSHDVGEPHHHHGHDHQHGEDHHHYGLGPAGASLPGLSQDRIVRIERDVLFRNDENARRNRDWFLLHGVLALNVMSGPGSGKTTLLERTLADLRGEFDLTVIEGDQQTSNDTERIRATGVRALQINTGKGCHLDAQQLSHALDDLKPADHGVMFIENVGNLVCPALFDLGEAGRVVMLSVTEGADKPVKYPYMFHRAAVVLLNKIDLLPHVSFDVEHCEEYLRQVNQDAPMLRLSATTGQGMEQWYGWLQEQRRALLNARAAQLERELAALRSSL